MEDNQILHEIARERKIEIEIAEQKAQMYNPVSEESKLNSEKLQLKKRILEIEGIEKAEDLNLKEKKMQQLRQAVQRHMRSDRLHQNQVNLFFNNASPKINPSRI